MKPGGSIVKVKEGNRAREGGRERRKDLVMIREPRRVAKGKEKREIDLLRDRLQQALWTIIVKGIPSFLRPPSSIAHLPPSLALSIPFFRTCRFSFRFPHPTILYTQVSIQRAPSLPLTCSFCCKGSSSSRTLVAAIVPKETNFAIFN